MAFNEFQIRFIATDKFAMHHIKFQFQMIDLSFHNNQLIAN